MVVWHEIVQRCPVHINLTALRNSQPWRPASFRLRSLLVRQPLEQNLPRPWSLHQSSFKPRNHTLLDAANAETRKGTGELSGALRSRASREDAGPYPAVRSHLRRRQAVDRARRAQRVHQQACDGHLPDAAGHRRDRAGDLQRLLVGDVADQAVLPGRPRHAGDADVDDGGARFNPVTANHFRPPDSRINQIGLWQSLARSRVRECAIVTVAFSLSNSCTSGRPTRLERPITIAFMPSSEA